MISILIVATLARGIALGSIPNGVNQDEAALGYNAFSLLHYGIDQNGYHNPVHLVAWGSGMNALAAYVTMPFIAIFGLNALGLRLAFFLLGVLTVWLLYETVRRTTNERIALISAGMLAISPWHIMLSRWSLESNLFPAVFMLGVYFFTVSSSKKIFALLAAVIFSLSLYAYGTAYLVVPIFFCAIYGYSVVSRKLSVPVAASSFVTFALLGIPIALFVLINKYGWAEYQNALMSIPKLPAERLSVVANLNPLKYADPRILEKTIQSFWQLFVVQYDKLPWNILPGFGYGYLFTSPFVLVGMMAYLKKRTSEFHDSEIFAAWAISSAVLFLSLTTPNTNRMNIAYIPLFFFAACGIDWLVQKTNPLLAKGIATLYAIAFSLFLFQYFTVFPKLTETFFRGPLHEAISYASEQTTGNVCLIPPVDMGYIHVLFAEKIPPQEFLKTVRYEDPSAAFRKVKSFGRYYFDKNCDNVAISAFINSGNLTPQEKKSFSQTKQFKNFKVLLTSD